MAAVAVAAAELGRGLRGCSAPARPLLPPDFIPPLGTNFVPTVTSLSTFNYAPIPLKVALQQYLPPNGFAQRFYAYNHPGKGLAPCSWASGQLRSTHTYAPNGAATLGSKVFTRGRFHPGKTYQWTHTGSRQCRPGGALEPVEATVHQPGQPAGQGLIPGSKAA